MTEWNQIASDEALHKTVESLKANGITGLIVNSGAEAKAKVLELIPEGAEVMTMTSVTLDSTGISEEINSSTKYKSVRSELNSMDRETQGDEMQKLGAAPTWTVGSVHAVTQDGKVLIASNTGSQIPAYAYGSQHVIWVVGAQKVTANIDDAMKRIYEHVLPLESERAKKAYGVPGSNVSKLLIISKEVNPTRLTVILVKEQLGY
jgi:hypothetical protein